MTEPHIPPAPSAAPRTPPRFVPTLTTVLDDGPSPDDLDLAGRSGGIALPDLNVTALGHGVAGDADDEMGRLEEQLLRRVMARVDPLLEDRLGDAVAATVEAQLDLMVPRLRRDMQAALRALISEALARELAENPHAREP
jgi:hypothetical protein